MLRSPRHAAPLGAVEWDDLTAYARIELALGTDLPEVRESVVQRADELLAVRATRPYGQPYAPDDGWEWGSIGRILGLLLIVAAAHRLAGAGRFRDGLLGGLDYVFGRNPAGLSYVTGWGTETAHRQRSHSETTNDVCIRWNAPLVLLAAYLSADASATSSGEKSGSASAGG